MEDFCRTCGITVDAERCINLFSSERRFLQSVRTITNCWVENVPGFPIYMCGDCQKLLKKIKSFRKRCSRIEAFLNKRKAKLNSMNEMLPATPQSKSSTDPLRIEKPGVASVSIKKEPVSVHQLDDQLNRLLQENNDTIDDVSFENPPEYDSLSLDEDTEEQPKDISDSAACHSNPQVIQMDKGTFDTKFNDGSSRKYTMRVGKRTMYIKLTDDKQPKRIVDRERQWASARPCICEHCGRQFKDSSNLNVHILRHTGTKNYKCSQCNEKCYTLHLLRRHQLKHTEGPYECTFCGLQYSTKSSRVRHEREACKKGRGPESKTDIIKRGERTFHCATCDLWFLRAGNLTQHMNSSNHIANERRRIRKYKMLDKKTLNIEATS